MLKIEQCDKLVAEGKMEKTGKIYHVSFNETDDRVKQILAANDLHIAFSEWWGFYEDMKCVLRDRHGIKGDRIVVIPWETCVDCGL